MWWHFVLSRIWRNLNNKDMESDRNRISEELLKIGGGPKIFIFKGGLALREGGQKIFIFRALQHTMCVAEGGGSQSKICPSLEGWQKFHIVGWGRHVEGRLLFQGTLNYYSMFF